MRQDIASLPDKSAVQIVGTHTYVVILEACSFPTTSCISPKQCVINSTYVL